MVISPLNYPGNKAKSINEIKDILPKDIDIFVDSFSGSGIVAFNSGAGQLGCNDINCHTIELLKYLVENDSSKIIKDMDRIILKYGFTDSTNKKNVYIEYHHEGLSHYNRAPFDSLKKDYNEQKRVDLLFALVIFGFNHYLRFNKSDLYNVPVGKVDFSDSLRKKTIDFANEAKKYKTLFFVGSFENIELYSKCTKKSVVYFDPPYLVTTAPYNGGWNQEEDNKLCLLFDSLNEKGIRVAMSNVFLSNGKQNLKLIEWAKKYKIHYLKRQYRNANYQKKNVTDSIEVLITNF